MFYTETRIKGISRNSAAFYWKSANLIGSPIVFYSPIKNDRARVALKAQIFLLFSPKTYKIVGFGQQSSKTIRLLALVFFER